jgi:hypothetical protein
MRIDGLLCVFDEIACPALERLKQNISDFKFRGCPKTIGTEERQDKEEIFHFCQPFRSTS